MKLSTRLTRAGAAFIVFGLVASVLPTNLPVLHADTYTPPPTTGGGGNNTGAVVAAVGIGGGLFALSRGGGGLFPYRAGGKKKKRTKKEIQQEQFNNLDRFTRPSDAGSNPGINH